MLADVDGEGEEQKALKPVVRVDGELKMVEAWVGEEKVKLSSGERHGLPLLPVHVQEDDALIRHKLLSCDLVADHYLTPPAAAGRQERKERADLSSSGDHRRLFPLYLLSLDRTLDSSLEEERDAVQRRFALASLVYRRMAGVTGGSACMQPSGPSSLDILRYMRSSRSRSN